VILVNGPAVSTVSNYPTIAPNANLSYFVFTPTWALLNSVMFIIMCAQTRNAAICERLSFIVCRGQQEMLMAQILARFAIEELVNRAPLNITK
jgi:hypothetical protein